MTTDSRMPPPDITFEVDRVVFNWREDGIMAVAERIHESSDTLTCDLTITSTLNPTGHVMSDRLNLTSRQTKDGWIRTLDKRIPETDWYSALEQVSTAVKQQRREGSDVVRLADYQTTTETPWLIDRFIPDGKTPSLLYSDGGGYKSMLALTLGISVATGVGLIDGLTPTRSCPVLLCDWEWAPEVHAERARAICRALNMEVPTDLYYRSELASLHEAVQGIRRRIGQTGAGFVIIDSLGFARGDDPNSAEATIRAFSAISSLQVPVLVIDHVAKNSDGKASFGSIYTQNASRMSWQAIVASREEDQDGTARATMKLVNRKTNGRWQKDIGLSVTITNDDNDRIDTVTWGQVNAADLDDIKGVTQQDQIIAAVADSAEGLTTEEIAQRTELAKPTVRTQANRALKAGKLSSVSIGKTTVWKLPTEVAMPWA